MQSYRTSQQLDIVNTDLCASLRPTGAILYGELIYSMATCGMPITPQSE